MVGWRALKTGLSPAVEALAGRETEWRLSSGV